MAEAVARMFSAEELRRARKAIDAILIGTWDGDWGYNRDGPHEHRDLLKSMDLWPREDE